MINQHSVLGVAVIALNGKPTKGSDFGKKVEFAMDLGPTMFPIAFAAICGRSMKRIARFRAERGAKISVRPRVSCLLVLHLGLKAPLTYVPDSGVAHG
jgi:hypothetical protein